MGCWWGGSGELGLLGRGHWGEGVRVILQTILEAQIVDWEDFGGRALKGAKDGAAEPYQG